MNVTSSPIFSRWHGVPCAESGRGPKDALRQGPGLSGLREGRRRELAHLHDADLRLLHAFEPLAFRPLAGVRWRSSRLHATNDQHARKTLEGAPAGNRIWPSLPGALPVFSGGDGGLFLPGCPLRRTERLAREPGGPRGTVALVEPSSRRARRPCISHPFLVAAAPPGGLAGNRQPRAVRGGVGCHAPLRSPRLSSGERRLGRQDRQAVGNRVDVTGAGEAEERTARRRLTFRLPTLPKGPKFGGWHLFSSDGPSSSQNPGGWGLQVSGGPTSLDGGAVVTNGS